MMRSGRLYKRFGAVITAVAMILTVVLTFPSVNAKAASGTVYTCTINRCYKHPVTGVIEDSGGEAAYATGQGMVEGCVYPTGILEVTDSGEYYLTIRMSLMDYTSGHSFWVQTTGSSDWSSPALGQTGSGSDNNGATADITIQVPSENCVVRGSMYVEPMGRDVIFYLYPSDFTEGNTTDMTATIVTAQSGSDASQSQSGTDGGEAQTDSDDATGAQTAAGQNASAAATTKTTETMLQNNVSQISTETAAGSSNSPEVNKAEGLSLSTAAGTSKAGSGTDTSDDDTASSGGNRVFQIALAVAVDGLILIGVTAAVVYFFRRNWRRWGGEDDDEE